MELHTDDQCQRHWRSVFSAQLDQAHETEWPSDTDENEERARWFREGIRYAAMIIRFDMVDESGAIEE